MEFVANVFDGGRMGVERGGGAEVAPPPEDLGGLFQRLVERCEEVFLHRGQDAAEFGVLAGAVQPVEVRGDGGREGHATASPERQAKGEQPSAGPFSSSSSSEVPDA
nr:hypothetical protein KPHV_47780 [Kitasatospora purpeofusca]